MIHLELIDQLFEACPELQFFVFDRRFLLPLAQLPEAVARETGQTISEGELRIRAGQGWFPLLPGAGEDGTEEGSPLYVPSRIGLLLKLQRQGYTTDELRLIAQIEERMIDNAYTTEDLAYVDDDLETIRLHAEARVVALECGTTRNSNGVLLDRTAEIDRARRSVKYVQTLQANGVPERLRETVAKQAFQVRAINEMIRVLLLKGDRDKISAGYSPFVFCSTGSWSQGGGYKGEAINWDLTVKSAIAYGDTSDIPPIRIPGFVLQSDRVIPTRTLRPGEYAQLWKEYDLDGYLECWVVLRGERRCLNCLGALAVDSDERKRFCSEKCRNAAKQRRHRERNPDSVERAHQRYWQSLDF